MPSISPETLVARLAKGKPVPAILLLGEDAYLRESCREQIVEASLDPASREWGVARFSAADDDLAHCLGQARSMPMLAPRQAVVIADLEAIEALGDKKRDAAVAELASYLADPAPFTVLILEATSLDARMRLFKLLAEKALVVSAKLPDDPGERLLLGTDHAVRMARDRGATIDRDAAERLADLRNSDLSAIRGEIEKLSTYVGPGVPIRRADVDALVVSEKKYSVWQLADMLASRQRSQALIFVDSLLREGEPPPAVIGAMAWMYRKLIEARDLGPNASGGQAAGRLGMRPAMAELAVRNAHKIPRSRLVEGLRALYDADSALKGGAKNHRAVMEFLITRLTSVGSTESPQ